MTKETHHSGASPKQIIQACKKGEQKAQFQLFKHYYQRMYQTSLEIIQDRKKAEEITQQAFLSAFEIIDSYQEQDNFNNWLENIIFQTSSKVKEKSNDSNRVNSQRPLAREKKQKKRIRLI